MFLPALVLCWATLLLTPRPAGAANMADAEELGEATLVLYNSTSAISAQLATQYARNRLIPQKQVLGMPMPQEERITRTQYRESIEQPLQREFFRNRWWTVRGGDVVENKIRFVVLIHGVPLKIKRTWTNETVPEEQKKNPLNYRDAASVDSELAAMGIFGQSNAGALRNPYYRSFRPINAITYPMIMLVARLDAPTPYIVMGMMHGAMEGERQGLHGPALIDLRNARGGGYKVGDDWLKDIAADLAERDWPFILDRRSAVYSMDYIPDLALYYGWYQAHAAPNFTSPHFRFRPGAVACHIHSFSAGSLRNGRHWVGPMLEKGAAVALGNTAEPYLSLTHNLDIFHNRLMQGYTVGEAAYMALPILSWQNAVFGDPLYRPFKQQDLLNPPELTGDNRMWQNLRQINQVMEEKGLEEAWPLFRKLAESYPDREVLRWWISTLIYYKDRDFEPEALMEFLNPLLASGVSDARIAAIARTAAYLERQDRAGQAIDLLLRTRRNSTDLTESSQALLERQLKASGYVPPEPEPEPESAHAPAPTPASSDDNAQPAETP
jgi:uncharacterized protein (TIGR03790 family)